MGFKGEEVQEKKEKVDEKMVNFDFEPLRRIGKSLYTQSPFRNGDIVFSKQLLQREGEARGRRP